MANVLIGNALELIRDELNSFLGRQEPRYRIQPPVILSDLLDQKGDLAFPLSTDTGGTDNAEPGAGLSDKLIITLINIEEETYGKAQLPYLKKDTQHTDITNPEIKLNLYVLFSAFSNMDDAERYLNCLNIISLVILFFQSKHLFDHQNTPALGPEIDKIIVELVSQSFEQQNYIWGTLGAKFMPSVLYKIRMLVIRHTDEAVPGPVIDKIKREGVHKK